MQQSRFERNSLFRASSRVLMACLSLSGSSTKAPTFRILFNDFPLSFSEVPHPRPSQRYLEQANVNGQLISVCRALLASDLVHARVIVSLEIPEKKNIDKESSATVYSSKDIATGSRPPKSNESAAYNIKRQR